MGLWCATGVFVCFFIPPSNTRRRLGQEGFSPTFTIYFPNSLAWYLVPQEELLNSANAKFLSPQLEEQGEVREVWDALGQL